MFVKNKRTKINAVCRARIGSLTRSEALVSMRPLDMVRGMLTSTSCFSAAEAKSARFKDAVAKTGPLLFFPCFKPCYGMMRLVYNIVNYKDL